MRRKAERQRVYLVAVGPGHQILRKDAPQRRGSAQPFAHLGRDWVVIVDANQCKGRRGGAARLELCQHLVHHRPKDDHHIALAHVAHNRGRPRLARTAQPTLYR